MSGVINIITKKGKKGEQRRTVTIEGGSYGTIQGTATVSGSADNWIYSLGVTDMYTDGFPSYGYRVNRPLTYGLRPRAAAAAAEQHALRQGRGQRQLHLHDRAGRERRFRLQRLRQHAAARRTPARCIPSDVFSSYNSSTTWIGDGFVRANATTGILTNHLTVFANTTESANRVTEQCYDADFNAVQLHATIIAGRAAAPNIKGELAFGPYGSLIFGARNMIESMSTSQSPNPVRRFLHSDRRRADDQFGLRRISPAAPLPARPDLRRARRFDRGRPDLRHRTRDRRLSYRRNGHEAARGLRQRRQGADALPALQPLRRPEPPARDERRRRNRNRPEAVQRPADPVGDGLQHLLHEPDRLRARPVLLGVAGRAQGGCYYNVGTAQTRGVEVTADATPRSRRAARARRLHLHRCGRHADQHPAILRAARNSGYVSAVYTGLPNLEIEPRLLLVGPRPAYDFYGRRGQCDARRIRAARSASCNTRSTTLSPPTSAART